MPAMIRLVPQAGAETGTDAFTLDDVLQVARANAVAVDRDGRFPVETLAAMRQAGLLSALVPAWLGGGGKSLRDVAAACHAIGGACASSAMILAMHQIQVACLVAHADDDRWLQGFMARIATEQLLLASITSEVGIGGSMRTSLCAVEPATPGRFRLVKQASTVSYGGYADAYLVTARARPDSASGDQVLVVVPAATATMVRTSAWNAMGMRGTSSDGFVMTAEGEAAQVMALPFSEIAARTMVPVSHLLWSSLWCGIAAEAVTRARAFLRRKLRAGDGAVPDGAEHLVQGIERLQATEARVRQALDSYERTRADPDADESFAEAAAVNMLKTGTSEACLAVVDGMMLVCGFAGYANEGPFSLSRHLRDLHSARLMVHNDRVRGNTARLVLMQAPQFGIA